MTKILLCRLGSDYLNILLSAYSINPFRGSEDAVGWNWLLQLYKNFNEENDKIYVVTKKFNEEDTVRGIEEAKLKNVELAIVDVPEALNWFREKHSVFHHMYYILWQKEAYKWAKKSKIKFDIIHHVSMGNYRITGKMYKIKDAYTIFGPVGGGQTTPPALKYYYSKQKVYENYRELVNKVFMYIPWYKKHIKQFDAVYTTNFETKNIIEKLSGRKCEVIADISVPNEMKFLEIQERHNDKIRIIYVGRFIELKGLMFLVDVVKNIKTQRDFEVVLYGSGELEESLRKKINELHLENVMHIFGQVEHTEISQIYRDADIFAHPTFRDSSGLVFAEAMANKLPIVALNQSFAKILNDNSCGLFVNTTQSREKIVNEFADKLCRLIESPDLRDKLGNNGYNFVNTQLTMEKKFETIYMNFKTKSNENFNCKSYYLHQ